MLGDEAPRRGIQIPMGMPLWAISKHRKPAGREKGAEQILRKKGTPNPEPGERVVGSETA